MKKHLLMLTIALIATFPASGYYCPQIPADCRCPDDLPFSFMQCNADPTDSYCYTAVSFIALGRMLVHPEDTSDYLFYANPREIGRFVIDDMIISRLPEISSPVPGDTIEAAHGGSCFSWSDPDSSQKIVAFGKIANSLAKDTLDSITASTVPACHYIPGCGTFILDYADGKVSGFILPETSEMDYDEFKALIISRTGISPVDHNKRKRGLTFPFSLRADQRMFVVSRKTAMPLFKGKLAIYTPNGKLLHSRFIDLSSHRSVTIDMGKRVLPGLVIVKCDEFSTVFIMR